MPHPEGQKHHYMPVFYTKQWALNGNCLCEYRRPYRQVRAKMLVPDATGYKRGLYSVLGLSPVQINYIEDDFLKRADQQASDSLRFLLTQDWRNMTPRIASGWSRFIMSLFQRTPERIAYLREIWPIRVQQALEEAERAYPTERQPTDPPTFAEYRAQMSPDAIDRGIAILMQKVMDLPNLGNHLNHMRWSVIKLNNSPRTFLTSDRPVIKTPGLAGADDYIMIPIAPTALFVACNWRVTQKRIHRRAPHELVEFVNHVICYQAKDYVYGIDESEIEHVEERLGRGVVQFIGGEL